MGASETVTRGVRVKVESSFLPARSSPKRGRWVFSYTITIANEGTEPVQLLERHWIITDSDGDVQEVRGPGSSASSRSSIPGRRSATPRSARCRRRSARCTAPTGWRTPPAARSTRGSRRSRSTSPTRSTDRAVRAHVGLGRDLRADPPLRVDRVDVQLAGVAPLRGERPQRLVQRRLVQAEAEGQRRGGRTAKADPRAPRPGLDAHPRCATACQSSSA